MTLLPELSDAGKLFNTQLTEAAKKFQDSETIRDEVQRLNNASGFLYRFVEDAHEKGFITEIMGRAFQSARKFVDVEAHPGMIMDVTLGYEGSDEYPCLYIGYRFRAKELNNDDANLSDQFAYMFFPPNTIVDYEKAEAHQIDFGSPEAAPIVDLFVYLAREAQNSSNPYEGKRV